MALILAIEPDRGQAARLTDLVRRRVRADLVLADTTEGALGAIGNRVPDLVLVPTLLSPQDDAAIAGALRVIAAAAHVQMLTIPVLGDALVAPKPTGFFARFRKAPPPTATGCDPSVFAEQIVAYLKEAAANRDDDEGGDEPLSLPDISDLPDIPLPAVAETPAPPPVFAIERQVEEPVIEAPPPQPIYAQPIVAAVEEHIVEAPTVEAPTVEAPIIEAPIIEVPMIEAPIIEAPIIIDAPMIAAPLIEEPVFSVVEPPAAALVQEPVVAMVEAPVAPIVEEAVALLVEEPVVAAVEEPVVAALEEPADPIVEEPAVSVFEAPVMAPAAADVAAPPVAAAPPVEEEEDPVVLAIRHYVPKPEMPKVPKLPRVPVVPRMPAVPRAPEVPRVPEAAEVPMAARAETPAPVARPAPFVPPVPEVPVAAAPVLSQSDLDMLYFVEKGTLPPVPPAPRRKAKTARPEWSELVASLRSDVERIRAEGTAPATRGQSGVRPVAASTPARTKAPKPIQDQWGLFDPEQCGFAALLAKLEEITEAPPDGASAHVISS